MTVIVDRMMVFGVVMTALVLAGMPISILADSTQTSWAIELRKYSIRVNADYTYEETKEETTLIRSQSLIDAFGQEEYRYSSDSESVEILEAYTILPNGERIEVELDQIRTTVDQADGTSASYSDDHYKIIIFPKLVAGARTHYKIKKTVHTPLYPGRFFEAYYFHPDVEFIKAQVDIEFPSALPIRVDTRGPVEHVKSVEGELTRHSFHFSQNDLKELGDWNVSSLDVSSAVFISSFKNYSDYAEVNRIRSEPKAIVSKEVRDLAIQVTTNLVDPYQKARALYDWVALNIRYVGVYFGDGGVVPHSSEETLRNLHGDCKDKSNLLIALLKAVDIEAENAIINSGDAFELPTLPVHYPMNHVITYIPEFDLFVDATQERAPFGVLGSEVRGKPAVLEKSGKVINTPAANRQSERVITDVTLDVDDDGYIHGTAKAIYFGDYAISARWYFDFLNDEDERSTIADHFYDYREVGVGQFTRVDDVRNLKDPMSMESTFILDPVSNIPGPGAIRVPVGLSSGRISDLSAWRPTSESKFSYPCKSLNLEKNYLITFPKGVRITHIPKSVDVTFGANNYKAKYEQVSDTTLKVKRVFISNRSNSVCSYKDYQEWVKLFPIIRRDIISQIFYE